MQIRHILLFKPAKFTGKDKNKYSFISIIYFNDFENKLKTRQALGKSSTTTSHKADSVP